MKALFNRLLILSVTFLTFGKIQFLRNFGTDWSKADPKWIYTPYSFTAKYQHSGWVYLNRSWLKRFGRTSIRLCVGSYRGLR